MPESFIQLPADSTGKKSHTRQRTIGANVIEDSYVIPISERVNSGTYIGHPGAQLVQAAATNGTTTGFWWMYNTSATVFAAVRKVSFVSQHGSILVTATSPRIALARFTFTGTPSGTAVTTAKVDSAHAASTVSVRTTQAGSTVTLGALFHAFLPVVALTAVGVTNPAEDDFGPEEESGEIVLRQNEGIVCYQPDAGTASDTRRFVTAVTWDEWTVP